MGTVFQSVYRERSARQGAFDLKLRIDRSQRRCGGGEGFRHDCLSTERDEWLAEATLPDEEVVSINIKVVVGVAKDRESETYLPKIALPYHKVLAVNMAVEIVVSLGRSDEDWRHHNAAEIALPCEKVVAVD